MPKKNEKEKQFKKSPIDFPKKSLCMHSYLSSRLNQLNNKSEQNNPNTIYSPKLTIVIIITTVFLEPLSIE